MCLFRHKWKTVYEKYYVIFLGEEIPRYRARFRICEKCGKAQEIIDFSSYVGPVFSDLDDIKKEVLLKKIEDKGDYYVLVFREERASR